MRDAMVRWASRAAIIVFLISAPRLLTEFRLALLTSVLIFGLLAASLDLLIGYTGLPSLGHAAFFGVGAYAAALVSTELSGNLFLVLAVATVAGGLVAGIVGALGVRSRGIYLLMLTLAVAELLRNVAETWTSVTGGANGIIGIPAPSMFSESLEITGLVSTYYYVLIAFAVGYLALRMVVVSPFGRALVGIRENPERMESLGYAVALYKLGSFVIAGAIGGYAGGLFVQNDRFISPEAVSFLVSVLVIIMILIGGIGTLYGPVLGAVIVLYLRDELSTRFERWQLLLGLVFVLFVYFLPGGIAGALQRIRNTLFRRRSEPATPATEEVQV
jgi:branched-chain amino acid transport system permease protein